MMLEKRYTADATITNPNETVVAVTITMDLGDWKRLHTQIADNDFFPAFKLRDTINSLIGKIEASQSS